MYLFTQQSYIINNTDKTLITCLLIFLFSIGNCHFNDIWHFVDWIFFIGLAPKYEVPKLNTPKYVTLQKLTAKIEHCLNIFLYLYALEENRNINLICSRYQLWFLCSVNNGLSATYSQHWETWTPQKPGGWTQGLSRGKQSVLHKLLISRDNDRVWLALNLNIRYVPILMWLL
jgi:hypothetical protein